MSIFKKINQHITANLVKMKRSENMGIKALGITLLFTKMLVTILWITVTAFVIAFIELLGKAAKNTPEESADIKAYKDPNTLDAFERYQHFDDYMAGVRKDPPG